jgi:hypothetical protein
MRKAFADDVILVLCKKTGRVGKRKDETAASCLAVEVVSLPKFSVKLSLVNFRKNRKISWLFTDLPFDSSLCGFGKRVD